MGQTTRYRVLRNFQWGQLLLDKGYYVIVEELETHSNGYISCRVTVEHDKNRQESVSSKAAQSMILLGNLEKV